MFDEEAKLGKATQDAYKARFEQEGIFFALQLFAW